MASLRLLLGIPDPATSAHLRPTNTGLTEWEHDPEADRWLLRSYNEADHLLGLAHTEFASATCGTIRLKLLKIGALVRVSVRRVKLAMASACPWQYEFELAQARLRHAAAR